jgi:hypothetical protein
MLTSIVTTKAADPRPAFGALPAADCASRRNDRPIALAFRLHREGRQGRHEIGRRVNRRFRLNQKAPGVAGASAINMN